MKQKVRLLFSLLTMSLLTGPVLAEGVYIGGGVHNNELTGTGTDAYDNATGFQIYAGYDFGTLFELDRLSWQIETGYFSSGDFDGIGDNTVNADGIWAAGVAEFSLGSQLSALGRLGYDAGDDDGLLGGLGLAFHIDDRFRISGELLSRQTIDSLQINMTVSF